MERNLSDQVGTKKSWVTKMIDYVFYPNPILEEVS